MRIILKNMTVEEFDNCAIWVAAGQSVDRRTLELMYHERVRHESILKDFRIEVENLAKVQNTIMNLVQHNRKFADTRHNAIQLQIQSLARNYIKLETEKLEIDRLNVHSFQIES